MRITPTIDVEPLPQDRMLAFHTEIGTATYGERTFEVTRSLTGLHFALLEKGGPTYTVDLNPVLETALESIVGDTPDEPRHGSIVLIHGATGTAFQRYFRDGLWHADGHEPKTWEALTQDWSARRVQVVYVAPEVTE